MANDLDRILVVAGWAVDEAELGRQLDLEEDAELKVADATVAETEAGEADPLLAVEDALVTFEADRIVLVAGTADEGSWSEPDLAEQIRDRFGLPVRELRL